MFSRVIKVFNTNMVKKVMFNNSQNNLKVKKEFMINHKKK